MSERTLSTLLAESRCVVCVGQGGVGKTSTSAALAIEAANQGQRSAVLTIDPARRLANALGLPEIGNVEREVPASAFEGSGLGVPQAKLTAMMLDIKEAWDEVVNTYHPDEARKARLLSNRLYEAMSTALAGSQEYMAMEKLYQLASREDDRLDTIILDTPPANHAVDFLEAPSRMLEALDNDATRWLLEPYERRRGLASRIFDAGSGMFIRTISKFTGTELLEDLAELLFCFQGMFAGFRERATAVQSLLTAPDTTFLVISTPTEDGVREACTFRDRLVERGVHVGGIVFNRGTVDPFTEDRVPSSAGLAAAVAAAGGSLDLTAQLIAQAEGSHADAQAQAARVRSVAASQPDTVVVAVPQLERDVHDLVGLDALRRALVGHN